MTEKRLRSSYVRKRRYDQLASGAAIAGTAVGLMLTGAALVPPIASGETVPLTSFAIGLIIIVGLTFLPYMAVRWRWRRIRSQMDE